MELPKALEALLVLIGQCTLKNEALLDALKEKGIDIEWEYEGCHDRRYSIMPKEVKGRKEDWPWPADWASRYIDEEDMETLVEFFSSKG